ncbi:uncharacterized protein LOC134278635, partial [Saccostrea cucullata]|uniref:uncharacterized protein LOC134278635 n=1 Tax=Saccostrea cuccullata TaxID=36930 RepID=UPI002ED5FBD6
MCPTTKEYIIKRAKIKHCQDFSSSFGEQLEYHCVLNDRGTGFVEVCSPVTKIIGEFCAEYNDGLGGIQPQKQKSCMGTCPFVYNSTASYKYGSVCYKGLRQSKDKDSDTKDPKTSTTYVNNITQDEKDFSLSDINETIHLQENGTIRKERQHFQSSRCEGCSYIAISYIAIAVLVSVLFIILYFKQNSKNSRQASQEHSSEMGKAITIPSILTAPPPISMQCKER